MADLKTVPHGLSRQLSREFLHYLDEVKARVNERLEDQSGLTGTYTFGGGSPGDVASMTFVKGILTAVTTV